MFLVCLMPVCSNRHDNPSDVAKQQTRPLTRYVAACAQPFLSNPFRDDIEPFQDIVFDSLSLLFLFTLDNSSSDLNVISCANWDDEVIGTFYWEKMQRYVEDLGYPAWSEDDGVDVKDIADQTTFPDIYYERMPYVYVFSIWFMGHCCVALPLLFLFTTGGTGTEARVQDDIQTLSQKFLEFGTTLDVLRRGVLWIIRHRARQPEPRCRGLCHQ